MATFSNADYSGPFSSRYEEHQALEGSSGNRAAHTAAQAVHSRGLRALERQGIGRGDTSIYGTNENPVMRMLNMPKAAQFTDPRENPMYNYGMQPRQTPSLAEIGPPSQRGMAGSGGFFPSLAGSGPDSNAQGVMGGIMNASKRIRQDAAMGAANIIGNPNDPRSLVNMGFSPTQAQDYQRRTQQNLADQRQRQFLYGDRSNESGTRATQETVATGDPDPTTDPNYIPPHLRYLMRQQQPVTTMSMGGIMALRPQIQQQQYEMGRQMAMRDMGKSV